MRCQLSVKVSRRHDVPIIVAAVVVRLTWSRRGRCAAAAQLIRDTSLSVSSSPDVNSRMPTPMLFCLW